MAKTNPAYPLNFELFNKDQEPVLYIARNNQQLTLEVVNQGQKAMQFLPMKQAPNSKIFHFAWTFRPDTLSDQCLKKGVIKPAPETAETWNMSDPMLAPNGEVTLYFTRKIPPKAKSVDWKPQEKIYLKLNNLAASGSQGSRGTRVQLKTNQLCFSGATQSLQLIRQTHLNVINHQGKQDCPLQVAVMGDASILNDGKTANSLTLRISNAHHYDAVNPGAYALRFKGNKDETKRSKIILQFPTGKVTDPSALLTTDNLRKAQITEPSGWKHQNNTWFELYPEKEVTLFEQATPLPGKSVGYAPSHVDIQLSNIITQHLAGLTYVIVHYQNIPGYWDGQRLVALEKSPLKVLTTDSKPITYTPTSIGIGTTKPTSPLQVELMDSKRNALTVIGKLGQAVAYFENNGGGSAIHANQKGNGSAGYFKGGTVHITDVTGNKNALKINGNTASPTTNIINNGSGTALHVDQKGTGNAASFNNGSVEIQNVNGRKSALLINAKTASGYNTVSIANSGQGHALEINQSGSGKCAVFKQGKVEISEVSGSKQALSIQATTSKASVAIDNQGSGAGLAVTQEGSGTCAEFDGGLVKIKRAYSGDNVLQVLGRTGKDISNAYLENNGKGYALGVRQAGSGPSAYFAGGQVIIKEISGTKNALHVAASTSEPAVNIENDKNGTALQVTQNGNGLCAEFSGAWSVFHSNVGIGVSQPDYAKLEIGGGVARNIPGGYGYLNHHGNTGRYHHHQHPPSFSVYAHQRIAASEFDAHSDARIKKITGPSNAQQDLDTLLKIQITDYKFKDPDMHGHVPQKKVIGQQIAQVFSQAAKQGPGNIPDVLQKVKVIHGYIHWPGHDFQEGERLWIELENETGKAFEIVAITSEGIRIDKATNGEAFIYGREVDDFHVVDYDAISMLNVSATQALHAQLTEQRTEIESLKGLINQLIDQNVALASRLTGSKS